MRSDIRFRFKGRIAYSTDMFLRYMGENMLLQGSWIFECLRTELINRNVSWMIIQVLYENYYLEHTEHFSGSLLLDGLLDSCIVLL